MPKKVSQQAKRSNRSAQEKKEASSTKQLALSLGGQLGKSLISGLVPVIVSAASSALMSGMRTPGPLNPRNSNALAVSAPAARGTNVRTGAPRMRSSANGNCTVSHREYVSDLNIYASKFDLQFTFGINPGNSALFPWLSTIAQRFELYKFRSLRVVYEPQTSSQTVGTVMIAVDYDASDEPPSSKTQIMSYKNSVRSVPWTECCFTSASADLHRLKTNYVLTGTPPPNADIKTYDIGNLYIAIQSEANQQPTSCGEIYVEYDIELITPQISNDNLVAAVYSNGVATSDVFIFGNDPIIQGALPVIIDPPTTALNAQTFTIQTAGYYLLSYMSTNQLITFTDNTTEGVLTVYSESFINGNGDTIGTALIQVIDTSTFQFFFSLQSGTIGAGFTAYLTISPWSQNALPNAAVTGPLVVTNNLRSRLGRRRTIAS